MEPLAPIEILRSAQDDKVEPCGFCRFCPSTSLPSAGSGSPLRFDRAKSRILADADFADLEGAKTGRFFRSAKKNVRKNRENRKNRGLEALACGSDVERALLPQAGRGPARSRWGGPRGRIKSNL